MYVAKSLDLPAVYDSGATRDSSWVLGNAKVMMTNLKKSVC